MTGNPGLDKIILALNAIVIGGACALVVYSHTMIKKPLADGSLEFGNLIEGTVNEMQKPPVTLDEIIVNLYSKERRLRYLNTQMNIDLFYERDREDVSSLKAQIFDAIIDIAGNMKPSELNSVTGRILLESRIKTRVNQTAKKSLVKKIYFSKFIVQ
mgnify:CR=1 FL=1